MRGKRLEFRILMLAVVCGSAVFAGAQAKDIDLNPNQIAQLRWWGANHAGNQFTAGANPYGLAFDGDHIWVANCGNNGSITEIRASDGNIFANVGNVGGCVDDVAWDGASIWVSVYTGSTGGAVAKLAAANFGSSISGCIVTGLAGPRHLAFDGRHMWVVNENGGTVSKIRASDCALLGTFNVPSPKAIAFDGNSIWVTSLFGYVYQLDINFGGEIGVVQVGGYPQGIVFDGNNIWVANGADNTVTKIQVKGNVVLGTFAVGTSPIGMAFDGKFIWVANLYSNSVSKLRASDGALIATITDGISNPYAVAFDGANIWVANFGSGTVTKI